jgi:hypothetical protein
MSPTDQPFETQDAILACCLHMAGVPFFEEKTDTETFPVPCINVYDEEILKKLLNCTGMTIEDATKRAFESGKKGSVKYLFKLTPDLSQLCAAYRDEAAHVENAEGSAALRLVFHMEQCAKGGASVPETLLRVACVILKMRSKFMNLWKETQPLIRIKMTGPNEIHQAGKSHIVSTPGFKVMSLNLSEKHRKQLRV